jgi:DNA-binding transcriptional LysR family regulator
MNQLTSMRVFVEAVERGSISAAAESLNISRAMATRYLEGLEDWLGTRLLHRTTRRLSLTDAGEQVLGRCRDMLALAEEVRAQANQDAGEARGRLRLTTTPSFAEAQLTAAVVDFQERYPLVEIELFVVDRSVDLAAERIDLAVRISNHIDPGLIARRLAVCESVLCASPAYLARHGHPAVPADLERHRCIAHSGGIAPEFHPDHPEQLTPIKARGSLTANETSIVRAAALSGAGIAMLPTYYVGDDLDRGRLELVLPEYALKPLDIQAVYLSRRHQPKPLRLLIDFLSERFSGTPPPWDKRLPRPVDSAAAFGGTKSLVASAELDGPRRASKHGKASSHRRKS